MTRFAGSRVDSDNGYSDGVILIGPEDFQSLGSGTATLTRNAKGDISLNVAANQDVILSAPLSKLLFRTGLLDDLQEAFGSGGNQPGPVTGGSGEFGTGSAFEGTHRGAANYPYTKSTSSVSASAAAVNIPVVNSSGFAVNDVVAIGSGATLEYQTVTVVPDGTHITVAQLKFAHTTPFNIVANPFFTPAGVSGRPPYTGVTQLVPVTSPRPKGIYIKDVVLYYLVGTNNLTSITIGLAQTLFANATALAISDVLAAAQNGLVLTAAATPYATRVAVASGWLTTDQAEYTLEVEAVVPATGGSTFRLYGASLHVLYNFN